MKILITILILLILILLIGRFEIGFNPFYIKIPRWWLIVGYSLIFFGINLLIWGYLNEK